MFNWRLCYFYRCSGVLKAGKILAKNRLVSLFPYPLCILCLDLIRVQQSWMRLYIWFHTMQNVDWLFVRMHKLICSLKLYVSERPKKLKLFPSGGNRWFTVQLRTEYSHYKLCCAILSNRDIVICTYVRWVFAISDRMNPTIQRMMCKDLQLDYR